MGGPPHDHSLGQFIKQYGYRQVLERGRGRLGGGTGVCAARHADVVRARHVAALLVRERAGALGGACYAGKTVGAQILVVSADACRHVSEWPTLQACWPTCFILLREPVGGAALAACALAGGRPRVVSTAMMEEMLEKVKLASSDADQTQCREHPNSHCAGLVVWITRSPPAMFLYPNSYVYP